MSAVSSAVLIAASAQQAKKQPGYIKTSAPMSSTVQAPNAPVQTSLIVPQMQPAPTPAPVVQQPLQPAPVQAVQEGRMYAGGSPNFNERMYGSYMDRLWNAPLSWQRLPNFTNNMSDQQMYRPQVSAGPAQLNSRGYDDMIDQTFSRGFYPRFGVL